MVKGSVSNQNFWWHKLAEISNLIFQDLQSSVAFKTCPSFGSKSDGFRKAITDIIMALRNCQAVPLRQQNEIKTIKVRIQNFWYVVFVKWWFLSLDK